jgi:hypothetical protein
VILLERQLHTKSVTRPSLVLNMSHSADKYQFHKHSHSAENEAKVDSSSFRSPRPVRQTRAGTDPGKLPLLPHCNVDESSTPRKLPTPCVELWTPYKEYNVYSYVSDNSRLPSKNLATAERVTKNDTEKLLLSVPSNLNQSRHDFAQDTVHTSSPEQITSSPTNSRAMEQGCPHIHDSNLASTVSTSDMLAGMGELSSLLAALNVQDGRAGNDRPRLVSSRTTQFADVAAQVDSALDLIQRWTMQTGDKSVLQSLSRDIAILSSNQGFSPAQLGGQDPPTSPPNVEFSSEQSSTSNPWRSNAVGINCGGNGKGKEASSQDRPNTKLAYRGSNKSGKLRCPLYFGEGQPCKALHNYPRDLM